MKPKSSCVTFLTELLEAQATQCNVVNAISVAQASVAEETKNQGMQATEQTSRLVENEDPNKVITAQNSFIAYMVDQAHCLSGACLCINPSTVQRRLHKTGRHF